MLPQNLIQNTVITTEQQNQFLINWTQAAQLLNLNFYHTWRSIDESEHYRLNQYPYQDLGNGPNTGTESTIRSWLYGLPLHSVHTVQGSVVDVYRTIFHAETTLTQGAQVVRVNDAAPDAAHVEDDFFVITPSVVKFLFSPNGWYLERNIYNNVTHIRRPFWGLKSTRSLNLNAFSYQGSPADGDERYEAKLWYSGTDMGNMNFVIQDGEDINEDRFFFATDLTDHFPIRVDRQKHQDILWGRIIVSNELAINVPVTVTRTYLKNESTQNYDYQYCFTLPHTFSLPSTGVLLLY